MKKIKFYSIKKQDYFIKKKIILSIKKIINKNNFILGKEVDKFEYNFSKFCGSKYSISCANGTDALIIALKALNLNKGSEVILPAMTYVSTVFAVIHANLKPVLIDIERNSPLIDYKKIYKKINKRTAVIMPVHLYGSVVNLDFIKNIIKKEKKDIKIIDDCAQAHGAFNCYQCKNFCEKMCCFKGPRVGSNATISAFSLYPGKNLGAYGDAGIINTNDINIYKKIRKLRNLGFEKKFYYEEVGFNSRLDTIQSVILNEKIKLLNYLNRKRILIARKYFNRISNKKIKFLNYSKGSVFHQFVIRVKERKKFCKFLDKIGIEFGFHYPQSINKIDSLKNFFKNKKFPNAEKLARECVSLPIDPMLNNSEIEYIIEKINKFK